MAKGEHPRSSRPRHSMPEFIEQTLADRGLTEAYQARPAYQRNDYIGWITRAKRPETIQKRLDQMLTELAEGGVYMGMAHAASRRNEDGGAYTPEEP